MIRFPIDPPLAQQVEAECAGWLDRAAERSRALAALGRFAEETSIWSEIKAVFIRIQHRKCVFCERPLPGERFGRGEHDLEHFRPKGEVAAWPTDAIRDQRRLDYDFETGPGHAAGYYWLAYDLANYAVACRTCNSGLKGNFFPIAASRGDVGLSIPELDQVERPFLVFPLGDSQEDPASLVTFDGAVPVPHPQLSDEHSRRRARVTIDFFALADPAREELWKERFHVIRQLWDQIRIARIHTDPEQLLEASRSIAELVSDASPHASCARCFVRLFDVDPAAAWEIYKAARDYAHGTGSRPQ